MASFIIYGNPVGKGRPRATREGRMYTPKQTVSYENLVKISYLDQVPENERWHEGFLSAKIIAYYAIAKSKSKKAQAQMEEGTIKPDKKPDVDNIAKVILDSLNGVAFYDDKAVVDLIVKKRYSMMPRVEVEIWEI